MSRENVEAFERALDAGNRRDLDAMLEEFDPEVEWHSGLAGLLRGEAEVYRGREGAREAIQDLYSAFPDVRLEVSEIRDLGDRVLAIGRMHARGAESRVEIESSWAYLVQFRGGKVLWVRSYIDPEQALEAAGLRE